MLKKYCLPSILFGMLAHLSISSTTNIGAKLPAAHQAVSWEHILPRIALVESSNILHANSYLGAHHGRGIYQIADICLDTYNFQHWMGRRFTKNDMYVESNARVVSLWHLKWLTKLFYGTEAPDPKQYPGWRWRVISAYNTGWEAVFYKGEINWKYVQDVLGTNYWRWAE
jgi:hypothetical protein